MRRHFTELTVLGFMQPFTIDLVMAEIKAPKAYVSQGASHWIMILFASFKGFGIKQY